MGDERQGGLLAAIETPADLRALPRSDLRPLADELRQYLIETVGQMGGHLAAGLGTVELAVALHHVFDTPYDRLIWDVGHQAYPHKVLTGRRRRLSSIKQRGGLAPFPSRAESVYDSFGVGHSSTSISAALGMAIANRLTGSDRRVVAVIGDGAMSAGLAWEALNHAGSLDIDLLVVLNDNDMSISENVGALSKYFARLLSGRTYSHLREGGKKVLRKMPAAWELARRSEVHAKGMVLPGTLFEEMGFNYIGPIDGHDMNALVTTLGNMRHLPGPQFLHVVTQKGKGYAPAEADPIKWHGPGPYDPASGTLFKEQSAGPTYSQVFGEWLCDMAELDSRFVGITPAMREGSGLVDFEKRFPERYFDVAIAEQHAVTLAAGLACDGMRPVVAIYSTFLRCVPNLVVMAPADENECRQMLYTAGQLDQPAAVRYPRGRGAGVAVEKTMRPLPVGRAELRRQGSSGLALLAFGTMVNIAAATAEALDATLVNMRFVKPLDEAIVAQVAAAHLAIVTLEENAIEGGAGSAVLECLQRIGSAVPVLQVGVPDGFVEHGSREDNLATAGLDAAGVRTAVERFWRGRGIARAVPAG